MDKLLVIGGNGFVGSAICRAAVRAGIPTASLSRRGSPSGADQHRWHQAVSWIQGDAMEVETLEAAFESSGCTAVISTAGTLVDESQPSPVQQLYSHFKGDSGLFERGSGQRYEAQNRDVHLAVAAVAAKSERASSMVFLSAPASSEVHPARRLANAGYFEMKRQAERELLSYQPSELRTVVMRVTAAFSEQQPKTLPIAAVAQFSQAADDLLFEPLGLKQRLLTPHLVPGPAIHVNTLADAAIEAAFKPDVIGVIELPQMFALAEDSMLFRSEPTQHKDPMVKDQNSSGTCE